MELSHESEVSIEEFKQRYSEELEELLEMGIYDGEPLPPDPSSMGMGGTNFEDLSDEQISAVRDTLFERLGVNPLDPESIQRTYTTDAPPEATVPGEIGVNVFKTNREGTFLQELSYRDGKQRWVIGPDSSI